MSFYNILPGRNPTIIYWKKNKDNSGRNLARVFGSNISGRSHAGWISLWVTFLRNNICSWLYTLWWPWWCSPNIYLFFFFFYGKSFNFNKFGLVCVKQKWVSFFWSTVKMCKIKNLFLSSWTLVVDEDFASGSYLKFLERF